jgi:hypothetical protein
MPAPRSSGCTSKSLSLDRTELLPFQGVFDNLLVGMVILRLTKDRYPEAHRWPNTEILKNLRRDSKLTHFYAGLLAEVARDAALPAISVHRAEPISTF